ARSANVETDNLAYSTAVAPLSPGEYRWRVRPLDGQTKPLAWASGPDFTISEPQEPSPSPTSPTPEPSTTSPTPQPSTTSPTPIAPGIPGTSPTPTQPAPVYQAPAADEGAAEDIAPDPPGKPRVTKVTKRKLRVHWRASEELGEPVSAYLVYRSTNGASFKRVRSTTSQTTRIKVKRGRTYWFYVVADSEAGRSGQSRTTRFRMPR
nr:fibronectin type III domain-containing protein [Actinomycetota bacterium]